MQCSSDQHKELVQIAIDSMKNSHPDNPPDLRFGAALITRQGNIYSSSAFWSVTLTLALHAEQAAIAHAAAHGERDIIAIACVSTEDVKGQNFCYPCGICKQLLYESFSDSNIDIDVVMANLNGGFIAKSISEIILYPWPSYTPETE